jgi:hypothetical protein
MRKTGLLLIMLGAVALACIASPTPPPTADLAAIVAQTLAAYASQTAAAGLVSEAVHTSAAETVAAALTQSALPPSVTPTPPAPSGDEGTPTPAPTESAAPSEFAPDPLPATHTGVIFNNGECFDFDSGQVVAAPDDECDVWLAEPALFRQVNGAQLSGYVTREPPSRGHCLGATYDATEKAVQTDLYYCFITTEGGPGFVVPRSYRGGIPFTGIVFDYWLFP